MAGPVTDAERAAMYKRIFAGIPASFLDPAHPNNKAVIGAIAYAVAYVELLLQQFEAGLFISTATTTDAGSDGVSSLARWGIWLDMQQQPNESPDAFRARIRARLFTQKVTIQAIIDAIHRATGLTVTIVETIDQVVQIDAGPWDGKKLSGDVYGPMAIDIITEGATDQVPGLMRFLRAAGTHWRHIETLAYSILLSLQAEPGVTTVTAWNHVFLFPPLLRADGMVIDGGTLEPGYLFTAGESRAYDTRNSFSGRTMLISGTLGAPIQTVEARSGINPAWPVLVWDDDLTLWGESVWAN